ncbi:MAG: RHS repeat-associated core domain-containing protein, partial [Bacteroidales bacterium]|nr:RHS repeat-associated core domain-containing protein [Bacteroidales bacterium]
QPAILGNRNGGTRELVSPPVEYEPFLSIPSLQPTGTPNDIFYYHMNHLGSTAFVTDQNQTVTQGFLYAPFGEITTEYNATFGNDIIPKYAFNAKELDEETGMYYYEARYYKPPVFTSRDPMFEKYFWMTPYAYCANNPVKYVDPNGREWDLSSLTDEQKAVWEKTMTKACDKSKLFKFIYNQLDKSPIKYTVNIGQTSYVDEHNVDAQYNPESQTFTFQNVESIKKFSAFSEEMFHAYQLTENNGKYDIGSFNYEFEAKLAKHIMLDDGLFLGQATFDGMTSFIDQFDKDFDYGSTFTSKNINETFLSTYREAANAYANYNKLNGIGNDKYQTATTVNPYSLIIMINSVRP